MTGHATGFVAIYPVVLGIVRVNVVGTLAHAYLAGDTAVLVALNTEL
jgi:hypothetical protein